MEISISLPNSSPVRLPEGTYSTLVLTLMVGSANGDAEMIISAVAAGKDRDPLGNPISIRPESGDRVQIQTSTALISSSECSEKDVPRSQEDKWLLAGLYVDQELVTTLTPSVRKTVQLDIIYSARDNTFSITMAKYDDLDTSSSEEILFDMPSLVAESVEIVFR